MAMRQPPAVGARFLERRNFAGMAYSGGRLLQSARDVAVLAERELLAIDDMAKIFDGRAVACFGF